MAKVRFPFDPDANLALYQLPRLALTLVNDRRQTVIKGLLDTGSAVNVLPYSIGLEIGLDWENSKPMNRLTGNLSAFSVRGVKVDAYHSQLTPQHAAHLLWAWVDTDNAPVIFGQMNFFLTFSVCFYRAQGYFDIEPLDSIVK